ncbi:MAG TPA: efflux RND transporter permease subunit, partial [Victivallales bacterium]|nr:efflux RND transporter permease subunit [Victivallales bacterium]
MFLSDFSVRRPVATLCVIFVIVLFGLSSYKKLGLSVMPEIDIPYITVTTLYPGANPEVIEVDVAKKIEDAVSKIDGLKHVTSTCMDNVCQTLLEFDLGIDVDVAAVDVREKINLIINDFPPDVEEPNILKFDINSLPVVTLLLTGEIPLDRLYDYAKEELSDQFSTIPGVAEVKIAGGEDLELHVTLDKRKLASTGLNVTNVVNKILSTNVKIPSGTIKEHSREFNVTMDSEMKTISDFENLEIDTDPDRRVYLRDIATIAFRSKDNRTRAFYNGIPAVNIKIVKKGDANSVEVVNRVKTKLNEINSSGTLPGGIKINWFVDEGDFTKASVDDAWSSVFLGIFLTAVILFMFLHEVRSTISVTITMPVSIIATFGVMRIFGYTLDNPTLLALGTSVGTLVTNSIVVIEDIFVKLEEGMPPDEAARKGTAQVALPVFASAMTNVVVFVPIAMMSSIIGRYFAPFAVTMTGATVVSLIVSFSLTPLLASKLLRKKMPEHHKIMRWYVTNWNKFYEETENFYWRNLQRLGKHSWWAPSLAIFLLFATLIFIAPKVGLAFFPDNDRGEYTIKLEFPSDSNLLKTQSATLNIEKQIRNLPEVLETSVVCGKTQGVIGQVSEGVFLSEIHVKTTRKNERKYNLDEMRAMFRNFLSEKSGFRSTVNVPSPVGGSSSNIEMEISGDDLKTLEKTSAVVEEAIKKSALVTDLETNVRPGKPELKVLPKLPILNDMNMSPVLLGGIIRGAVDGTKAGTYKLGDRSLDIRVISEEMDDLSEVTGLNFGSKSGKPLNIETISESQKDRVPIQIVRVDKSKTVKVYANPQKGVALGTVSSFVERQIPDLLPPGYKIRFAGQIEKMKEGQADFLFAIISAIILTYLLIAASIESWTKPLIIMGTVPLALIGMFLALFLARMPLSMMGLLGF